MKHQIAIKIFATQVRVPAGGFHFKNTFIKRQKSHVQRPATHIINDDIAFGIISPALFVMIQAIRNGRGRGLVDDTQHV